LSPVIFEVDGFSNYSLDAFPECGDTFEFGSYIFTNNIICDQLFSFEDADKGSIIGVMDNDTVIDCSGHKLVGPVHNFSASLGGDDFWGIIVARGNNITVKNCIVENSSSGLESTASNLTIINNTFRNLYALNETDEALVGLRVVANNNSYIINNSFYDINAEGGYWSQSEGKYVPHNILIMYFGETGRHPSNIYLRGNIMRNVRCSADGCASVAVMFDHGGSNYTFTGNIIENVSSMGAGSYALGLYWEQATITDFNFVKNILEDIYIVGSGIDAGMYFNDYLGNYNISRNNITNTGVGIMLRESANQTFSGNILSSLHKAIDLDTTVNVTFSDVFDNVTYVLYANHNSTANITSELNYTHLWINETSNATVAYLNIGNSTLTYIEFRDSLIKGLANTTKVNVTNNSVEIDSSPGLSSTPANITFLTVNYVSLDDYDVLADGVLCTESTSPSCKKLGYSSVKFTVSGFGSTFTTQKHSERRWLNITTPEGVFEPNNASLVGTHVSTFNITILNLTLNQTSEVLKCFVKYPNGSLITFEKTGVELHGVNFTFNYTITENDSIVSDANAGYIPWIFKNCSVWSGTGSLIYSQQKTSRIYVHDPVYWSDNEITRAVTCEGTPGVYFNNTGKCEFSEDTMFALQMRNGNPVNRSCFNNPGVACADDYCNGIFFPTCDPIEYFAGYSPQSDDPNGYTTFTASFAGYSTPIAYTYYTNPSGTFKLRVGPQSLTSKSFSITIYNFTNVDASATNVYGPSAGKGTVSVTNQGDGTWSVAYYNFSDFTGTLDFVFNVSFTSNFNDLRRHKIVIAYGTDTNQGNPPYFNANSSTTVGLQNNNESETTSVTTDTGGVCGDEANNDFDYIGGTWSYSYDCFDPDCNMSQGDDSQINEFGSGKTGKCNYNKEFNCSDEFDNDYDYILGTDFTDCHDADCFHVDLTYCPLKENVCNDGINNDWDYTLGESDDSSDMKIENNGTKYDSTHKADVTDCEDIDCNWSVGGSSGEICTWGYERNCSDSFDNDALQLYDCQLASVSGTTTLVTPAYGEYDCAGYCRTHTLSTETGSLCDDNKDNDWDAIVISGYYTDQYSQNTTSGAGIDCRWGGYFGYGTNYNPDEDCNMTILSSGYRCELAREINCTDGFDNDFDKDASGMPSAGWSNNPSGYQTYYGTSYAEDADGDDYDCKARAPSSEAFEASWCFDGVDNDLDAYYWSGGSWTANASTGIDCADPDCMGVTNPSNPSQTCLDYEYNASDPFFDSLSYPGFYCDNGLDDDADGPKDCADTDCFKQFDMCSRGPCYETENITWDSCMDNSDNDYADGTDCADSDCIGMLGNTSGAYCESTESSCDDSFDNDDDGNVDCADSDCAGQAGGIVDGSTAYCRSTESTFADCYDGFDNDADGSIDCYDSSCNAVCNLTTISGTTPVSLPVWAGQTSLNSVTSAYIQDYTRKVRKGQWYNITFKMASTSSDAQWTIGTASGGKFNKSAFNVSSAHLDGPNAGDFSLVETVNGFILDSNGANLPSGYTVSFLIQSNITLAASTYELTYAEATGSETSLNNYIYHEIVEDVAPEAHWIRVAPNNTKVEYGSRVWLRANVTDNNALGACDWYVYGAETHNPANSTSCRASFAPSTEGTYYINVTPVDYYSNIGSPIQVARLIDIVPTANTVETNKTFYYPNSTLEFNATFNVVSTDTLGTCRVYLKNSTVEKEIAVFSADGNKCYNSSINLSQVTGIGDGIYQIYAKVAETTDGDTVYSAKKAIFVCSQVDNGTCGYADFNADGKADLCPLPPNFEPVGDILLDKNFGVFYLNLTENVSDERTSDRDLNFTWSKNATGIFNISIDNYTNIVNFTSIQDAVGSREVTITVIDRHSLTNSSTFTVTVRETGGGGGEEEGGGAGGGGAAGGEEGPECGNGVCEDGEDYISCPADCEAPAVCGNGVCEDGEDYISCPADCEAPAVCGNGVCEDGEDKENCPEDCKTELEKCIDSLMADGLSYGEAVAVCEESGEETERSGEAPSGGGGGGRKVTVTATKINNSVKVSLGKEGLIKIVMPPNATKPKVILSLDSDKWNLLPPKYSDWWDWLMETITAALFILLITGFAYSAYSAQRKILYEYVSFGGRRWLFRKAVIKIRALNDLRSILRQAEKKAVKGNLRMLYEKEMAMLVQYINAVYGIDGRNIKSVATKLYYEGADEDLIRYIKETYALYYKRIVSRRKISRKELYDTADRIREIINKL